MVTLMDWSQRINRLKVVEVISYRLCYAVLQCERLAHEAAKELMLSLFRDERFFTGTAESDVQLLRKEASVICGRILKSEALIAK